MNHQFRLFGPLTMWHFLVAGLLAYAVPLGYYLQEFIVSGTIWAAILAIMGSIILVRRGCRFATRPLEYGNRFVCIIIAAAAIYLIFLFGIRLNLGLAYISFTIAGIACAGWLGSWALVRSLGPVWLLSLIFVPNVIHWLQFSSIQIWDFIILPTSRILDYFLVPNDISDTAISLAGGKSLGVISSEVKSIGLNALVVSTVISFLHNRSFFFTLFASAVSLLTLPLFAIISFVFQCFVINYLNRASSLWLAPLLASMMVFLLNITLQFFGSDHSEWIWQEEQPTLDQAGSVFEGCDFGPFMLFVLLLFSFSGLASSALFVAARYNITIF